MGLDGKYPNPKYEELETRTTKNNNSKKDYKLECCSQPDGKPVTVDIKEEMEVNHITEKLVLLPRRTEEAKLKAVVSQTHQKHSKKGTLFTVTINQQID